MVQEAAKPRATKCGSGVSRSRGHGILRPSGYSTRGPSNNSKGCNMYKVFSGRFLGTPSCLKAAHSTEASGLGGKQGRNAARAVAHGKRHSQLRRALMGLCLSTVVYPKGLPWPQIHRDDIAASSSTKGDCSKRTGTRIWNWVLPT